MVYLWNPVNCIAHVLLGAVPEVKYLIPKVFLLNLKWRSVPVDVALADIVIVVAVLDDTVAPAGMPVPLTLSPTKIAVWF